MIIMSSVKGRIIKAVKNWGVGLIIAFLIIPSIIKADGIVSVSMNPTNPGWGQQFVVYLSYCVDQYNAGDLDVAISTNNGPEAANTAGQIFLISNLGIDVHSANPNSGGNIGYPVSVPSPFAADCTECGGSTSGMVVTSQYTLTMPEAADMGSGSCGSSITNLYLVAAYQNNYMNWGTGMSCSKTISWPIPAPTTNVTIHKEVEGTLALVGDEVLYEINYSYVGNGVTISDPIPGGGSLALVDFGPNPAPTGGSISGNTTIGETSGTITWTLPNETQTTSGTVWMLLQMTTAIPSGTVITNTATGTSSANTSTSSTNLTVGTVALSLTKQQSINTFLKLPGATVTITYFLNYQINGDVLKAVRMFDDDANGTYSGSPPPGWKFQPQNGTNGVWTISDPCNTGDRILTGSVPGSSDYPALLLDDPANESSVQICDSGIIESDVMINPGDYPGADGLVVIRSNGQTGNLGYAYSLLLSIDTNPAGGYVGMQVCGGGTCTWPAYVDPASLVITGNTWYRVKVVVSNNGFTFSSKVWQVGQPEPSAYQMVYTDTADETNANWECPDHGGTNTDWRPGVEEQGDDSTVMDSYNNFLVFNERTSADTVLYDTVPTGLTYQGANPAIGGTDGSMITWNLGTISDQSGSYTWWATTNACNESFTNVGGIAGNGAGSPAAVFSNQTVFNVECTSPTPTITPTGTPAFTISKTSSITTNIVSSDQLTFSIAICNNSGACTQNFTVYDDWSSGSNDDWQYQNPYYTSSPAPGIYSLTANVGTPSTGWTQFIFVPTPTGFSGCFTFQMFLGSAQHNTTCNWHNNASVAYNGVPSPVSTVLLHDSCPVSTPTFTYTPTYTSTPTFTATKTPSPTYTQTVTFTFTYTYTFTNTNTPTPSVTVTSSVTFTRTNTPTFTATPSPTATPSDTFTFTTTITYTQTVTYTFTYTVTPSTTKTITMTITYTNTPSPSPTATPTFTYSLTTTDTYTRTVTYTSTYTPTPSNTITQTSTITMTNTTVIISATITVTFTVTKTSTLTYTPSPTNTASPTLTNTLSPTVTYTWTVTYTFTFTDTPTNTITYTPTISPTSTLSPPLTLTNSPSITVTFTITPTPTYTVTFTPTYTDSPQFTYTVTLTWSPTQTDTSTNTDTQTFTPTLTDTPVNSATDTPTDSPTCTNTPTQSFTSTVPPTVTWSVTYTFTYTDTPTSTITDTPTITPTPTITATSQPYQYLLNIGIYNEAGELVKSITVTASSGVPQSMILESGGNSTNVVAGGSNIPLNIDLPGVLTAGQKGSSFSYPWYGTNDAGQSVANGVYYIRETTTDQFGNTDVITKPVTVINESQYAMLNIYNSAGELVNSMEEPYDGTGQILLDIASGANNNSAYVVGNPAFPITIKYSSDEPPVTWYGKNSQGDYLDSGVYEVQLIIKTNQVTDQKMSQTITLLNQGVTNDMLAGIKAYPNPYASTDKSIPMTFSWIYNGNGGTIKIKIYNIAGELVRTLAGNLSDGSIAWDMKTPGGQTVSNGTYICIVEGVDGSGSRKTKVVKIAAVVSWY